MSPMSLMYRVLYRVGFTPWERMAELPIADEVRGVFDRVEADQGEPLGQVLDLGCGSGRWDVELARRGWQVTGVDQVPSALKRAQARAAAAGVDVRFLRGDVTALDRLGIGQGIRLFLDFGLVHGLSRRNQEAVARQVDGLAAEEADLVMFAFQPSSRRPMPRGMSRQDIEEVYRGWEVVDELGEDLGSGPALARRLHPRWYRLHRG